MATKLKSSESFAIKSVVILMVGIIFQKTCNCNKLPFAPKIENFMIVTSLRCFVEDPNYLKLNKCILKAINRTHKYMTGHAVILKTFQKPILIHFRVLKRANGGYKPFGIDVTLEGCQYLEGKRNLIFDWFYKVVFPYSNLNHSCPFNGEVIFNVPLRQYKLPSVFPDGEYRFEIEFGTLGKVRGRAYADIKLTEV